MKRSHNIALALVLAGCTLPHETPRQPVPATRATVVADWNDLEAAVLVAASRTETSLVDWRQDAARAEFELASIRDEPVMVTARRQAPGDPSPVDLTCWFGPFGDAGRQARFLKEIARRLEDLRGVDYRKVR